MHIDLFDLSSKTAAILLTIDPALKRSDDLSKVVNGLNELKQQLDFTLQHILQSDLFSFAANPYSVENFNIRVAVDVVYGGNSTVTLFLALTSTITNIIDSILEPLHEDSDAGQFCQSVLLLYMVGAL